MGKNDYLRVSFGCNLGDMGWARGLLSFVGFVGCVVV